MGFWSTGVVVSMSALLSVSGVWGVVVGSFCFGFVVGRGGCPRMGVVSMGSVRGLQVMVVCFVRLPDFL